MVLLPLALGLGACSFGLAEASDAASVDTGTLASPPDDDAAPNPDAVSADLTGRVYALEGASMTVVEPPGLDALWDQVLTRDVLVYIERDDGRALTIDVTLAGADGAQDPCESVRRFPDADWSENPAFVVGPGQLDTTFGGGHPASFRKLVLAGTFAQGADRWTEGTLDAVLDTRELAPALSGMGDLCELVEQLGGVCSNCDDGVAACFELSVVGVTAEQRDVSFDPSPSTGSCG
jgi:hypothetical protein